MAKTNYEFVELFHRPDIANVSNGFVLKNIGYVMMVAHIRRDFWLVEEARVTILGLQALAFLFPVLKF